jgi:glycosyltransferase involved in cell wall biosynthesis
LEGGGAERVFVELASQFAALNLRVDLVLARAYGPYLAEVSPTVRLVDLAAGGVLQALPKLVRYLRRERPEVMLSGLNHSNIVAILARFVARSDARCVISMRSVPTASYREEKSLQSWVMLQLMSVLYPFADDIIANSDAVAVDLAQLMRLSRTKPHVVHNPLKIALIEQLCGEAVDHAWCGAGAPPIVLSVGRLDVLKDFPTLIRAFEIARGKRECHLLILGEGPQRKPIESLIGALGLQACVQLPGFVGNPFAWMRCARVFVSSSLTEGCPNAVMQALACGTQVVSTNCVGGSAEILEQGRWGRLVGVGDVNAMAEAIVAALDVPSPIDVRERASDFAIERIARQYLSILLPTWGH